MPASRLRESIQKIPTHYLYSTPSKKKVWSLGRPEGSEIPRKLQIRNAEKTVVPGEGGGTPYNGLYGEVLPERGTFNFLGFRYIKG